LEQLFVNPMDQSAFPSRPKLLDRVRTAIRMRGYSLRTEEAYVGWIRRFIFFHGKQHPADIGPQAITPFSTTQIYTHVLNRPGMNVRSPADF
jgi:hypothetical protein